MLSVHPRELARSDNANPGAFYAKGWETPGSPVPAHHIHSTGREQLNTADPHIVAKLVKEFCWSPIVWKYGTRLTANFGGALWVALDFDDGTYGLAECLDEVTQAGLTHVLGTTKSYQKAKGESPACDRFRLLLRLRGPCTDAEVYGRIMRACMELWPCDRACKDAARFYYPCTEIVSAALGLPFRPFDEDEHTTTDPPKPPPRKQGAYASAKNRIFDCDRMTRLEQDFDLHGAFDAVGKHDKILQIIPAKLRRGWPDEQVVEYVRARTTDDKTEAEIRNMLKWWREGGRFLPRK